VVERRGVRGRGQVKEEKADRVMGNWRRRTGGKEKRQGNKRKGEGRGDEEKG
jgi:hypothetical protein